jgi:hypothetical protein
MIEEKSPVMLNTITEHDFHNAFKKIAEALDVVHTCGRGHLRGVVASATIVSY